MFLPLDFWRCVIPHVDRASWLVLRKCSRSLYEICKEVQRNQQMKIQVNVLIYKEWAHHSREWLLFLDKVPERLEIDDPLLKNYNPVRTRDFYHVLQMSLHDFMKRMGYLASHADEQWFQRIQRKNVKKMNAK